MGQAIGDVLAPALGVAISPVPIIAVVLMLGTARARATGTAFGAGWIVGLVSVTALVLVLSSDAGSGSSDTPAAIGWIHLGLGALFWLMALRQWRGRPRPGVAATMSPWMSTIDSFSAGKAFGIGVLLSGANPKNLALSVAAATGIAQAGLATGGDVAAVAIFVLLGSLTVVGPVVAFLASPRRASSWLGAVKETLAAHNAVIMAVLLTVLGAKLLGDGLRVVAG